MFGIEGMEKFSNFEISIVRNNLFDKLNETHRNLTNDKINDAHFDLHIIK